MAKPIFLLWQIAGDFLSIGQRLQDEGNEVYLLKQKGQIKGREDTGVGIFDKNHLIDNAWEVLNKVPQDQLIIITDDNGQGAMFDYLRDDGWKVIGGSAFGDKIEYERGLGTKLMGKIGLGLPEEYVFNKIDEAIDFLDTEEDDARFVFKPEGEAFAGSSLTYTGKNKADLIGYLTWVKEEKQKKVGVAKFLMQEFVDGIEADFSAYFNGVEFMPGSIAIDIEEKKTGDGNKGEACGCMGNVVVFLDKSRYFDEYIKKLTPLLKKANYVGQVSINNIFASGKQAEYEEGMPYGLEFTPRFGWDAHLTEDAIHLAGGKTLTEFYSALANKDDFKFNTKTFGVGIRVYTGSISLKKDDVAGRYFSYDPSIEKDLWFYSASYKNDACVIEDNPVLVLNHTGKKLNQTIDESYKLLKKLNVPDVYYRMEIGQRAEKVLRFLRKYNWI